jgi:hypothetical protein
MQGNGAVSLFEQLKKWEKENPKSAENTRKMLEIIEKSAAITYQPLVLPNLEFKSTDVTPSIRL